MANQLNRPVNRLSILCFSLIVGMTPPAYSQANPTEASPPLQLAMMDDMKMGGAAAPMSGMRPMENSAGEMPMGASPMNSSGGGGMGCCMGAMGQAPGSSMGAAMATPSALPGFPGASHLYHVGASGFFLDHATKISIGVEQQTKLNAIKERALKEQADGQRQIEAMEEALWTLTAAEQPELPAIEAKLREIEKAKADQRITFIRAVGEAASVLTPEQQKVLLGKVPMPKAKAPSK